MGSRRSAVLFLFVCLSAAVFPPVAAAQQWFVGGSLGRAVPRGGLAEYQSTGPLFAGSVGYSFERITPFTPMLRADVTWLRFQGDEELQARGLVGYGNLRSVGGSLNLMLALPHLDPLRPYALYGIGRYTMQIEDLERNRNGPAWGATFGVGAELRVGRVYIMAEAPVRLMLTDYGSREVEPAVYYPLSVGLRVGAGR